LDLPETRICSSWILRLTLSFDALIASISGLLLSLGIPAASTIFWRSVLPLARLGLFGEVERLEVDAALDRLGLDDVDHVRSLSSSSEST
jgi:hypothetical protein